MKTPTSPTVHLIPTLYERLREFALAREVGVSALAEDLIRSALARKLSDRGRPRSGERRRT